MGRHCSSKRWRNGQRVLIWGSGRGSKTRRGNGDARAFYPTAQAANNERCPVHHYKKFRSHRPPEMINADSPFYLAINYRRRADNSIWYLKIPLGKNEIGKFMKIAAQRAGLQGNITNHSVRKTRYFSPHGCRSPRQLRRSAKRAQKPEEPRFVQSSVS